MIHKELFDDVKIKWENIRKDMREKGFDACLLTIDVNLFYVTGRIYSGYFYLPVDGEPLCFVKRPNGLSGDNIYYIRKPEQIVDYFSDLGIKKPEALLLEADELAYSEYVRLQSVFSPQKTGNATELLRNLRRIKTPWELEQFRISGKKHTEVYREIPSCYTEGMTDLEFQYELERLSRKNGSFGIFRAFGTNMDIFMGSVLAGKNAEVASPFDFALGGAGMDASCPIGANGTRMGSGTTVMVDIAGNYTPYISDMTRTFSVGKVTELAYRAHQVSLNIVREVETKATPGFPVADIYNLSLAAVEREGLSDYFMGTTQQAKFVGHGIGLQINELPVLMPRSKDLLAEGMVFALEPKFVIPEVGAVGIENSYIVTAKGVECITNAVEEIIEL